MSQVAAPGPPRGRAASSLRVKGLSHPVAFTLPPSYRPSTNVFIPVDLCNATNGRIDIASSGVVSVG